MALTQLELAEQLGVSDKAASRRERGVGLPCISLLPSLAKSLGADVKALLDKSSEKKALSSESIKIKALYLSLMRKY